MSQQFQLQPPPDDLRTPLVQLKDHYVQQIIEYEKSWHKLWISWLMSKPCWKDGQALKNYHTITHVLQSRQQRLAQLSQKRCQSYEGDVPDKGSSLMGGNGNASGAVKENGVTPHQENGASSSLP
jgi:hypothetical protein